MDATPGMTFKGHTFIAQTVHPIWPSLSLVIWRMADGGWSHDALNLRQEIGTPAPSDPDSRMANLRRALLSEAEK